MKVVRYAATAGALLLSAGAFSACGSDSDADSESQGSEESAAVVIENVWARTSPTMASSGAVYFDATAADADAIVGATVDPQIAAEAQIHEVVTEPMDMEESSDMDMEESSEMDMDMEESSEMDMDMEESSEMDMDMGGTMTMSEVDAVTLSANETLSFAPGSFHVMLIDLANPLEQGQTFELTLHFQTGPDQTFSVEVKDSAS